MKDYYMILNVSINATNDEIKKAFRSLAKKYHPDRNKNDENAVKKFQEINEAYGILSNEESRKKYDEKRSNSNNKSEKNKGFQKQNTTSGRTKRSADNMEESMADLNNYFKNFFGFDDNSDKVDTEKLKKQKNPIDTSSMFESFFNIKKK